MHSDDDLLHEREVTTKEATHYTPTYYYWTATTNILNFLNRGLF